MTSELPPGLNPTRPPTGEDLERLSADDISAIITWWRENNYVAMGVGFWLDELGRRRAESALHRIADETESNAAQVARMTALIEEGAAQNRTMTRLTWVITGLTVVNVLVAFGALSAALEWL